MIFITFFSLSLFLLIRAVLPSTLSMSEVWVKELKMILRTVRFHVKGSKWMWGVIFIGIVMFTVGRCIRESCSYLIPQSSPPTTSCNACVSVSSHNRSKAMKNHKAFNLPFLPIQQQIPRPGASSCDGNKIEHFLRFLTQNESLRNISCLSFNFPSSSNPKLPENLNLNH